MNYKSVCGSKPPLWCAGIRSTRVWPNSPEPFPLPGSYTATGDYYFSNNGIPSFFIGAGVGIFSVASARISPTLGTASSGVSLPPVTNPAGCIRCRLRGQPFPPLPSNTTRSKQQHFHYGWQRRLLITATSKNSYLGIKLGFFIGGGRLD